MTIRRFCPIRRFPPNRRRRSREKETSASSGRFRRVSRTFQVIHKNQSIFTTWEHSRFAGRNPQVNQGVTSKSVQEKASSPSGSSEGASVNCESRVQDCKGTSGVRGPVVHRHPAWLLTPALAWIRAPAADLDLAPGCRRASASGFCGTNAATTTRQPSGKRGDQRPSPDSSRPDSADIGLAAVVRNRPSMFGRTLHA